MDIQNRLFNYVDEKYREFSLKLNPSESPILGIRVPNIRAVAKEIAKNDYISYLDTTEFTYCEQRQLYGLVINLIKTDLDTKIRYFDKWLNFVDSWAVCDIGVLKSVNFSPSDKQKFWDYLLQKLSTSKGPFTIRAIIVCMFDYLATDKIHEVAKLYCGIKEDHYYVKMAVAWGISIIAVKDFELALKTLQDGGLSDWVKKKAIQKCCESYRISNEQKSILRKLI